MYRPCLYGAAIDDEVDESWLQRQAVQERAPLRGRAVGGDPLARRLQLAPAASRPGGGWRRLAGRSSRYGRAVAAPHDCSSASRSSTERSRSRGSRTRGHDPQRAAVDRQPLDTADAQAVPREEPVERGQREVAEVLVVDRVELAAVDQVLDVGRLDDRHAVVACRMRGMPATKPFRSGTWARTLLAWMTSARLPSRRQRCRERRGRRTHASVGMPRCSRATSAMLRGRLDARAPGRRRALIVLQQVAVVARDLDDQAVGVRAAARAISRAASVLRVPHHRVGERREVEVVAEQLLGRHRLGDLHERARRAEDELERVASAPASSSCSARQQRVRERRRAERRGPARRSVAPQERQRRSHAHARAPQEARGTSRSCRRSPSSSENSGRPAELLARLRGAEVLLADLVRRLVADVRLAGRESIRRENRCDQVEHRHLRLVREVERLARAGSDRRASALGQQHVRGGAVLDVEVVADVAGRRSG